MEMPKATRQQDEARRKYEAGLARRLRESPVWKEFLKPFLDRRVRQCERRFRTAASTEELRELQHVLRTLESIEQYIHQMAEHPTTLDSAKGDAQ